MASVAEKWSRVRACLLANRKEMSPRRESHRVNPHQGNLLCNRFGLTSWDCSRVTGNPEISRLDLNFTVADDSPSAQIAYRQYACNRGVYTQNRVLEMAIYHSLRLVSLRYADLQLVRHGFELNNVSIRRLDGESGRFIVRVGRTESSKEVAHAEFAYDELPFAPFFPAFHRWITGEIWT